MVLPASYSTVEDVLFRALARHFYRAKVVPGVRDP